MDTNNETPGWTQVINTISRDLWNSAEGSTHKRGYLLPRPQPYRKERVLQAPARATGHTVNTNPRAQPDGSFSGGEGPTPQWLVASQPPLGRSPGLPFKLDECVLCVLLPMLGLGTKWGPRTAQQGAAADRDSWGWPGAGPIRLWVATAKWCFFHLCFS